MLLTPRRWPEVARWLAVVGVAGTLTLGLCRLIDYYTILDRHSDRSTVSLYHPDARLDARSDQQAADAARPVPKPFRSDDLVVRRTWVGRLDIDYALGLDGLNLVLILTGCVVAVGAVVSAWGLPPPTDPRPQLALVLVTLATVTAALESLDLVLFVAFDGLTQLAAARVAGRRFLGPSAAGSGALVAAVLLLHAADVRDFADPNVAAGRAADARQIDPTATAPAAAVHSFDPVTLGKFARAVMLVRTGRADRVAVRKSLAELPMPGDDPHAVPLLAPGTDRDAALARLAADPAAGATYQLAVFALLAAAFAARLAVFPLSGWLTAALPGVPTPAGLTLVGLVTPVGGYGLIRYAWPLAPGAAADAAQVVSVVGLIAIAAGLARSLTTTTLGGLAAAGWATGAGFVVLAVGGWGHDGAGYERGVAGAVVLLPAVALGSALLVFVAGCHRRRFGHADLDGTAGLGRTLPRLAAATAVGLVVGAAVPGTAGFVGTLGVLTGTTAYCVWLAVPAAFVAAGWSGHRVYLATRTRANPPPAHRPAADLDAGEGFVVGLFAVVLVGAGVLPSVVFAWLDPAVQGWADALARLR